MIARVIATGEIIEAEYNDGWIRMTPPQSWIRLDEIELLGYTEGELKFKIERAVEDVRKEQKKNESHFTNWGQRRYELAKEMMLLSYKKFASTYIGSVGKGYTPEEFAEKAVAYADALIAELKKGGKK